MATVSDRVMQTPSLSDKPGDKERKREEKGNLGARSDNEDRVEVCEAESGQVWSRVRSKRVPQLSFLEPSKALCMW